MKMLCIDGGGIRGVFPIKILAAIERELGDPLVDFFDVIAGTSTGAVIAASVTLKRDMNELLNKYKKYGEMIFKRQAKLGIFKSVYSDKYLRHFLKESFGQLTLNEIRKPLILPSVDVTHGKPYVFRSNYGNYDRKDLTIPLWDAVLSSCSAPLYFPPNNIKNRYLSVDGGLWANNPSLVCVTEGLRFFKKPIEDIRIFSLGTGEQNIDFSIEKDMAWGMTKWLPIQFTSMKVTPKLLDLALNLSSETVTYQCKTLLGENYLRINKELGGEVPFDDVSSINQLLELADQAYKEERDKIISFIKK
ncbi:patatin-like phospholipase/acyl hydrolase [Evansella vedderi]|uniref:Patatin-like phospholipase/acyl hydrolase n=1 Tax=Evansella vedderi TaxID=38282 RepID=A0ABT9ZTT4_9BACI|nr:CBASS cGAMP-activated phospholipase [Evansella vedderi]MDQ0254656.1 patatin-like phospholipase/acyl hydrolase [Evansella vedderi]